MVAVEHVQRRCQTEDTFPSRCYGKLMTVSVLVALAFGLITGGLHKAACSVGPECKFGARLCGKTGEHRAHVDRATPVGRHYRSTNTDYIDLYEVKVDGVPVMPVSMVVEMEGHVQRHSREIFSVRLTNGADALCTLGGRLRASSVWISPGDLVKVHMSPYDLNRGRIVKRISGGSKSRRPLKARGDGKRTRKTNANRAKRRKMRQERQSTDDLPV